MQRHYQLYQTPDRIELYEVMSDNGEDIIPVHLILDGKSREEIKNKLKEMLTDIDKYDMVEEMFEFTYDEDDELVLEFSDDVVVDCAELFERQHNDFNFND